MKRVYRIKFIKSSFDLNEDFDGFPEQDRNAITEMLPSGYFEYNDYEGHYTLYIILKPTDADKYSLVLDDNLVAHSVRDISEELLDGMDLNTALLPFVGALNIDRYRSFKIKLEKWIMSNLDIDRILDRINEVGMPNISKLEKKFLDDFQ